MKPAPAHWTIVILGRWNVSIFNPDWLGKNLFDNKELFVEVPMEPGLPMRFTGDNVLLIPHSDRVILGAKETTNDNLTHMEKLATKLVDILPHTPIGAVGVNFGYDVRPIPEKIREAFRNPHAKEFTEHELTVPSKSFKWSCKYHGETVNMSFDFDNDKLLVKSNFHSDAHTAAQVIDALKGKVLSKREFTETILKDIYELELEDI